MKFKKVNTKKTEDIAFNNLINKVNEAIKKSDSNIAFYNLIKKYDTN